MCSVYGRTNTRNMICRFSSAFLTGQPFGHLQRRSTVQPHFRSRDRLDLAQQERSSMQCALFCAAEENSPMVIIIIGEFSSSSSTSLQHEPQSLW